MQINRKCGQACVNYHLSAQGVLAQLKEALIDLFHIRLEEFINFN